MTRLMPPEMPVVTVLFFLRNMNRYWPAFEKVLAAGRDGLGWGPHDRSHLFPATLDCKRSILLALGLPSPVMASEAKPPLAAAKRILSY